ncbi:hypothetical protein [Seonamhaeicola aphaedonensis]|uniref:Uncharacterized protein n=1 Tax=Seonamhaeicola aphaedonensis TaxID=1461338 RepID=A0A3D9H839_9FLAO|nr:hypothetical protein [Seonamhaeicola aphaedonensis]RED45660.1 hypothetical protein DFQ02_10838 [Seonamhaeicola aphaedonensis]
MKTKPKQEQLSLKHYRKNEIKNPETILGGVADGPIERDKIRRATVR